MPTPFTSEIVARGHPDKLCDQVSDAILDECLAQDPDARVAVETALKSNTAVVLGEVTTSARIDIDAIVRETLAQVHPDARWGLDVSSLNIVSLLTEQSPDISAGVHRKELGAGDQGLMFGYATSATQTLMPVPMYLCQILMMAYEEMRQDDISFGPDAKVQVTALMDGVDCVGIDTVVFSAQHAPSLTLERVRDRLKGFILQTLERFGYPVPRRMLLNQAGVFLLGGPQADAGLTGRKIIADSYGGWARHGGGAYSGKDGTKVDRSGAYGARQLACDVVSREWARSCEVGVSYAIGYKDPIHIDFVTDTGMDIHALYKAEGIDPTALLSPQSLMDRLGLTQPGFFEVSYGGHFGRNMPWDRPLA